MVQLYLRSIREGQNGAMYRESLAITLPDATVDDVPSGMVQSWPKVRYATRIVEMAAPAAAQSPQLALSACTARSTNFTPEPVDYLVKIYDRRRIAITMPLQMSQPLL